jgi:integrase/recombinase XerC
LQMPVFWHNFKRRFLLFFYLMGSSSDQFLQYLRQERRFSPHTLTAYENDLKQFSAYLSGQYGLDNLLEADAPLIRSWFALLLSDGYSRGSINRKISSLKSFYKYQLKNGEIAANPMDRLRSVKKERKLPVFVQEDKLAELFDPQGFKQDFSGLRDLLMLELLYTTGIRLSELLNLRHGDIDPDANTIRVTGKRDKQRMIPLLEHVKQTYQLYCREKEKLFETGGSGEVLVTDKGKKTYPAFVYRRVIFYLRQVTTRTKKSPHVLRHSFATHMLDHGADLNAIKEILGHASLAATQVYTHNTIEKIKTIYKQAHPKA